MSRLIKHEGKIPKLELAKAVLSWLLVVIPYGLGWLLTYPMGILVALTSKPQKTHPQGKKIFSKHSDKYIAEGSSGEWEY